MVRVGLIGFGLAGASFHAPLIATVEGMELAAIATSRPTDRFPQAVRHGDPMALIDDDALDLIVIATPNDSHAPLAQAALAAGRHVVVDKPLATDDPDAVALVQLARGAGRRLSVFHNRRWDSDFLTVERLLREDALGEVHLAELRWDRFRPAIKPGWREEGGPGSGLLNDLGPHMIDQAIRLFGMPDAVAGDVTTQRDGAGADDYFEIVLRHGARRVTIGSASLVAAPRPRFALHGTKGSYVKYGIDPQEAVLRAGGMPTDSGYGIEPDSAWGLLTDAEGNVRPVRSEAGDWRGFYRAMRDAIRGEGDVPVDPVDAVRGLRIIDAARAG
ncbi:MULTISPECIES: oxidoreductase [unclassified Sphingomonas]|uniref:oxidoreductase n=1 Tax=unclassified Sphingomonas TaxID=196159 RepID=UPI0006F2030A|nr:MULTISPECIES: oxidoreductase [unclassified Sphingomonas]KQM61476.1 oxidoreductase [Sphingomonas sp. Leaf16]KQN12571.1 oxidoreductase [Sphingomonas sp. Leaf29]KQN19051.1 oxidoreductase [Sphingomonas sp. Leaf32]